MKTVTPKAVISQMHQNGCEVRVSFWIGTDKIYNADNCQHPGEGFSKEELEIEIQRLLDTIDQYPQHVHTLDYQNPEDGYYFAQCAYDWYLACIKGYKVYDVKTVTHAIPTRGR
jgi:hypothetical protein